MYFLITMNNSNNIILKYQIDFNLYVPKPLYACLFFLRILVFKFNDSCASILKSHQFFYQLSPLTHS